MAQLARHAGEFGTRTGPTSVDMHGVVARQRAIVEGLIAMHLDQFKSGGAELMVGSARLTGPRTIEVMLNDGGTHVLTTDRLFLNLGTHATIPDAPGLATAKPLTNIEASELDQLPVHLVVLGGLLPRVPAAGG